MSSLFIWIHVLYVCTDELRKVIDHKYGSENPNVTGGWDGVIGELVRKVGHLICILVPYRGPCSRSLSLAPSLSLSLSLSRAINQSTDEI